MNDYNDYLDTAYEEVKSYFASHDIPNHFYYCFFGELVKVWGIHHLIPNKNYLVGLDDDDNPLLANDDYSYKDQIDYFLTCEGGTGGWNLAFKESCKQCDMMDMYEYYSRLDWVRSDYFDGCLADKMVEELFDEDSYSGWYTFVVKKEN